MSWVVSKNQWTNMDPKEHVILTPTKWSPNPKLWKPPSIFVHIHTSTSTSTYTYTYTYTYTFTFTFTFTETYTYAHMNMQIHIHIHLHTYYQLYIYICIHNTVVYTFDYELDVWTIFCNGNQSPAWPFMAGRSLQESIRRSNLSRKTNRDQPRTLKVCKRMACKAMLRAVGPFFCILLGSRTKGFLLGPY